MIRTIESHLKCSGQRDASRKHSATDSHCTQRLRIQERGKRARKKARETHWTTTFLMALVSRMAAATERVVSATCCAAATPRSSLMCSAAPSGRQHELHLGCDLRSECEMRSLLDSRCQTAGTQALCRSTLEDAAVRQMKCGCSHCNCRSECDCKDASHQAGQHDAHRLDDAFGSRCSQIGRPTSSYLP